MTKEDFIKILNEKIDYYHRLEMEFEDSGDVDRAEQNFWKWQAMYLLKHELDDVKEVKQ